MARVISGRHARRGIAAVELALVMSFILPPLLLGTWEVGRLINVKQMLSNAAREGARQASTGQISSAQVQQVVLNYLQNASIPTTHVVVTVSDITNAGTDVENAAQLDQLQVALTIPFADVRWIGLQLITNNSSQLSAQATWYSLKDQNYPTSVTAPAGY